MAKMVVECQDPNDLDSVERAVEFAVGRCNVTYYKQAKQMVGQGVANSKHDAAKKLAEDTGESVGAVRQRIDRGQREVAQPVQPQQNGIKDKNVGPVFNETNENIEWAKWTWNPVTGCKHGCKYCYARDIANRFYKEKFEPTFRERRLSAPRNTPTPKSKHVGDRNVFVCSMADLFGEWVPQNWIDDVLAQVDMHRQWNFLFLTKNPKRLVEIDWPPNAWVGTTIDCQKRVGPAEEAFANIKATVKFVSCEPLLEELEFNNLSVFDWIIIGSQSRSSNQAAKQPDPTWVLSLLNHAQIAGCKTYCKPNLKALIKEYPIVEK